MKATKEIVEYLISKDKKMKEVIGDTPLVETKVSGDYFADLVDNIVSQQLSGKVAEILCLRLTKLCGGKLTVGRLKKQKDDDIRACGISYPKIKYLRALSDAISTKEVDLKNIHNLSDQEVIDSLVKVKGIGPWSAEMFLLFSLERPDIYSFSDGGLTRAVSTYYFHNQEVTKEQLLKVSEKWAPYRSYASLYLWRSLERKQK